MSLQEFVPTPRFEEYSQAFGEQLGNLVAEGPAVQKALASIGDKGASLSDAFDVATMAMLPLADVKNGQLNAQGTQMLKQFAQTYDTVQSGGIGALLGIERQNSMFVREGRRWFYVSDVPTLSELGVKGYDGMLWMAILAPLLFSMRSRGARP